MPLDTYTEHVVEGLKRGESTITTRGSLALYEKYETGKEEDAQQFWQTDNVGNLIRVVGVYLLAEIWIVRRSCCA